jgi:hypothetical protein
MGSFVRFKDFKHCAQSRFDKGRESGRQFIGREEIAEGKSITHLYIGRFIMFSMITNIYNKNTKGPTLMEFFTATGKLKSFFFFYL